MKCKPWEIWWASVRFEDSCESVVRPVLVIDVTTMYAICIKMTKTKRQGEYSMLDWVKSGLSHETTIRQTKLLQLIDSDLKSKIGNVSMRDKANIIQLIN